MGEGERSSKGLTEKQGYWLEHIQRCGAAGESMAAYAKSNALDLNRLYRWKRRLIRLVPESISVSRCRIGLVNGVQVETDTGVDSGWLQRVLQAASGL